MQQSSLKLKRYASLLLGTSTDLQQRVCGELSAIVRTHL